MVAAPRTYPAMPEIGHPESYYARLAKHAERKDDTHAHEAAKVGQYVTLAIDPNLRWPQKLRYFKHAINRHCNAPRYAEDACWTFYHDLADLIRQHCGNEALRRQLAGDLDRIVAKAAHAEAGQRYGSVDELANDVRAYLESRPVQARGDSFRYLAGKFVRRWRYALAAGAAVLLSLVGVTMVATYQTQQARAAQRSAVQAGSGGAEEVAARGGPQLGDPIPGLGTEPLHTL